MKNKFYKPLLLLSFGVVLCAIWSNVGAYAQNKTALNITSSQSRSSSSSSSSLKPTITSPTKGQQVLVGKDLTIYGTSKDNATSNCQVSVKVNNVKPYQNATATGTNGNNDYSKWKFDLTSKYTTIKEGPNKITARYNCVDNPDLNLFFNRNITGVLDTAATTNNQTK